MLILKSAPASLSLFHLAQSAQDLLMEREDLVPQTAILARPY
jgi:hypothetical protein